jgi:hypothetical protein
MLSPENLPCNRMVVSSWKFWNLSSATQAVTPATGTIEAYSQISLSDLAYGFPFSDSLLAKTSTSAV